MLKNITIGQYVPADTTVHNLDPRVKIMATFIFIIFLFLVTKFYQFIFVFAYIGVCIFMARLSLKHLINGLKPVLIIILFTVVLNIFMTQGQIIYKIWILSITKEGLYMAGFLGLRLMVLIVGASILTLTTSPIALTDGIEKLLNPFKRIGVPAHELAMMMTIALRFIPTLLEETDKIIKAQQARGADFESGNIVTRSKAMIPILIPLFISSFRRADELALAMESRCYRGGEGRTRMKQLKIKLADYMAMAFTAIFCIVIIISR